MKTFEEFNPEELSENTEELYEEIKDRIILALTDVYEDYDDKFTVRSEFNDMVKDVVNRYFI